VPRRERLRWEKELLGLYLSEHPLSDIESVLPEYVTAYVGDLAEETDGVKVTVGGIIAGSRRVITRAGSTMLVAALEDLTGSVEVVVFPKVFADTANAWTDDSVVLVTGRVDHRDEGSQILCEAVHGWDDAVRMGPVAFSAERDRLLRARAPRPVGARNGNGNGGGYPAPQTAVPVAVAEPVAAAVPVAEPDADEAPVPAGAVPLTVAPPGAGTIEIGFEDGLPMDRLLPALESVTAAIRGRPGSMPVVISIPVAGAVRQVRLPHLAEWDDRLGEVVRQAAGLPVAVELRPTPSDA
jgi:DNA polymerase-3 subunit alpha